MTSVAREQGSRTRLADGLLVAWIVVGGACFFQQFVDLAVAYFARLLN